MENNNGIYQFEGDFYVKLPSDTVWNLENNISLRKELNCNFLCSVLYKLYENTNMKNITFFSIEELMESCGYKNDKRITKKFKELLLQLEEINVISDLNKNIKDIKTVELVKCKLNLKLNGRYFMIYSRQFESIFASEYDVQLKNNAFTFFCYIISRMKAYNVDKVYQYTFFTLKQASEDLGISRSTLQNCIKLLKECFKMNIDHIGYIGAQKQSTNNIYALDYDSLIFGLKQSYNYYIGFKGFKCKEEYENIMGTEKTPTTLIKEGLICCFNGDYVDVSESLEKNIWVDTLKKC